MSCGKAAFDYISQNVECNGGRSVLEKSTQCISIQIMYKGKTSGLGWLWG